jgi:uncharacterized membrane protein
VKRIQRSTIYYIGIYSSLFLSFLWVFLCSLLRYDPGIGMSVETMMFRAPGASMINALPMIIVGTLLRGEFPNVSGGCHRGGGISS